MNRAKRYGVSVVVLGALLGPVILANAQARAANCESLAKLALPKTTITMAQSFAAGELAFPVKALGPQTDGLSQFLPAICRIQATLHTSSSSEEKMELWLPQSDWNGSLMAETFPGFNGSNTQSEIVDAARRGYGALMSAGAGLGSAPTTYKNTEMEIDWGYRGLHEMVVASKALMASFYGSPVKHAYFLGCSEGGREGFNAAHHYPEDFDGIAVGGSGNQFAKINAAQLYPAWLIAKNPARFIPEAKYAMVHDATIKACDALDGVTDGVIEDPRNCHFDPKELLCKGDDAADCLTAPQVELLQLVHEGPRNPRTGEQIFPGPAVGAELPLFEFSNDKKPMGGALNLYQYLVFDPSWDFRTLDYDKDVELAIKKVGPFLHTTPADLKAYIDRGGKLLIWDGWNDFNSPYYWISYYTELQKLFGAEKVSKSVQMYFSPGMNHCSGGEGCDNFDKLGSVATWVETGQAPPLMIASHLDKSQVIRTRPMCAYPKVDQYKGAGNTNDAANFECVDPKAVSR